MVIFYDEGSQNPMPPGIIVLLYSGASAKANNLVDTEPILLGGYCNLAVQPDSQYTAVFVGAQAPTVSVSFVAAMSGDTSVTVALYSSPTRSQIGWAKEQISLWPRGQFSDAAKQPGGNAYAVAAAAGSACSFLDVFGQAVLASMRLPTSSGAALYENLSYFDLGSFDSGMGFFDEELAQDAIDSWASDFFGSLFTRCANLSDAQWITEIEAILGNPKPSLTGMTAIIAAALPCINQEIAIPGGLAMYADYSQGGGADEPQGATGITFADAPQSTQGAQIVLFDAQSNPTWASFISPNIAPGQFCVYLRNPNDADSLIHTATINSPTLKNIVNACKSLGVAPVYAQNF